VAKRIDDAVKNCERFAPFGNAEAFLGDRVTILSEAGRHQEAIAAANALLDRFPDHAWSHIFAADAFRKVGDKARTEASYRKALELEPTDSHTVEGVLERLVPWFEKLGRTDEAQQITIHARSRLR
jgi:tetratricopeptide (TPR) repeat protein